MEKVRIAYYINNEWHVKAHFGERYNKSSMIRNISGTCTWLMNLRNGYIWAYNTPPQEFDANIPNMVTSVVVLPSHKEQPRPVEAKPAVKPNEKRNIRELYIGALVSKLSVEEQKQLIAIIEKTLKENGNVL